MEKETTHEKAFKIRLNSNDEYLKNKLDPEVRIDILEIENAKLKARINLLEQSLQELKAQIVQSPFLKN